jgi:hypothetical protein
VIDGAIGELSQFHQTFGYYAHGVDQTTAVLPPGWEDRLIAVRNENTGGATGWCLEVHDLACAKLVAGRERDADFVRILIRERMASAATIRDRLGEMSIGSDRLTAARRLLEHADASSG